MTDKNLTIELLNNLMMSWARAEILFSDDVLKSKLLSRNIEVTKAVMEWKMCEKDKNLEMHVAQFREVNSLLEMIDDLCDLVEVTLRVKDTPAIPLLTFQCELLKLKTHILEIANSIKKYEKEIEYEDSDVNKAPEPDLKFANINQEKIYNFIKETQRTRVKDVIQKFPEISERTIQRTLKDLVDQNMIQKNFDNKVTFYSPGLLR